MPDYSVGNAPGGASYAAPLVGFQFGKALSDLPDEYFKGTQQARQLALQKPILDPVTGQPSQDASVVAQELMRRGGAEYAKELLPFLQKQPFFNKLLQDDEGGGGGPYPPPLARTNNNAGGPQYAPTQQPTRSVGSPGEGEGDTINSVVTETMGGKPFPPAGIFSIARQLGINPSANLTPQQVSQVKGLLGSAALPPGSRVVANQETNPPNVENSAQEVNGNAAKPSFAEGVSGGAAPIQSPLGPKVVRTQSVINPQTQEALKGLVPDEYLSNPRAWVEGQRRRAEAIRRRSHLEGIVGIPSKAGEDQAAAIDKKIQNVEELIGKVQTPTTEQQNLRSGATQRAEELKHEIARSDKTYGGMNAQSSQYERDLKPYLDVSRSILNDPDVYTGTGGDLSLMVNRVKAMFGDQKAAMLQEALQKVTATSVLGQINLQRDQLMEAGGNSGRIFSQQVDLVGKAAPQMATTKGGNRFLVEVSDKMGRLSTTVTQKARDYIKSHGHLDTGFDDELSKYLEKNPVFSQQELAHPDLLGEPTAPPGSSVAQVRDWGRKMGLKEGESFRYMGEGGKDKYHHMTYGPPVASGATR
jgi:hypothetical protein